MQTWVPAFRDGHAHPLFAGREALGPQLDGLESIAAIQEVVQDWAEKHPTADWIVGGAYERSLATSFLATWLDEVVPDRPVVLHASDHHTIWVNSEALRRVGALDRFPEVFPGYADLDSSGRPLGTLRESGAMDVVLKAIPALSMQQELEALKWAQQRMLETGISQVQDAWIEPGMAEIYLEALNQGLLKVRTNLAFRITPENFESEFSYYEQIRAAVMEIDSPLLTAYTAKFFADGVLGSGTAALVEPYEDTHHHGEPVWEKALLERAASKYASAGYQLHIHAIGDAAVRDALDVIERAPATRLPPVIAHAELISSSDLARFSKLGVVVNMQPLWAKPDGMLLSCQPRIGRERIERMYQLRSLVESGATLSFGSDWPVSSVNPLEGIQTAVTRSYQGEAISTKESLTVDQALAAYTSAVAKQLGDTSTTEQVLLSEDPRSVPLDEISTIQVLEVRRGQETLFSR